MSIVTADETSSSYHKFEV